MSAFLQSKDHVDALLRVALDGPADRGSKHPGDGWGRGLYYYHDGQGRYVDHENVERIGAAMVAENVRSVQYRYQDSGIDDLPGPVDNGFATDALLGKYHYGAYSTGPVLIAAGPRHLTTVEALKAIDGYTYQSCEHPAWESSEAATICRYLKDRLIGCLPGYDEADTWEV